MFSARTGSNSDLTPEVPAWSLRGGQPNRRVASYIFFEAVAAELRRLRSSQHPQGEPLLAEVHRAQVEPSGDLAVAFSRCHACRDSALVARASAGEGAKAREPRPPVLPRGKPFAAPETLVLPALFPSARNAAGARGRVELSQRVEESAHALAPITQPA